ncbi:urease accessory protein UreF [Rufibacter glacialis]|uniref:Urease accessory protein UreF n=1 Tax=Rufibacter glacialis TaxID=1259555 RepID=A0A5M8QGU3_9BACT|nr:urease accessory protein UreF [Rufibacter glacialis]KAA6434438.1 urease accessory protein UreF [Rufibacter glacialis]GGK69592.1 urease accessory protein UreF [Rufibacter glacialis]
MQPLLTLLQINDSMFPIGGFTQSYGLESYVSQGIVKDTPSATVYARDMLSHNIYYNDAAFLQMAWKLLEAKKSAREFQKLDELITALKAPSEIRMASKKLAIRFLKLTQGLQEVKRCSNYLSKIQEGKLHGHYPVAFAMYAFAHGISLKDALMAFYYNTLNGIVTNCAKLVPISQNDAQKILFNLQPTISQLVEKQEELDEELVGLCCIGQEIRCMQHEKQYSRLYIS